MVFHEEYEMYRKAGINTLEEKLDLSRADIYGMDAKKYALWGFHGNAEAMKALKQRFNDFLHDPSKKSSVQKYVEAGFAGNLDAILELSEQRKFGGYCISPDEALFLAEHGLKGNKEAMLDIPAAISDGALENLAYRIAFRLEGKESYTSFVRGGNCKYDYAVNLRRKFAEQIHVSSLILLEQYNIGEEEAEEDHPINVKLKGAYARKDMLKQSGKIEAAQDVEKEIKDLTNEKFFEKIYEIENLRDDKLMEAYSLLNEHGVNAFKEKYKLNEGWVYDGNGKLYYHPSDWLK